MRAYGAAKLADNLHAVRFYHDDASLCRLVARFVAEGLAGEEPAILVATPAHRDGILSELAALDIDVEERMAEQQLLPLDVNEVLDRVMRNGMPDAARFHELLGDALQRARNGGQPKNLRAYGELVDVLWKRGEQDAAIKLEILWNELARAQSFSLLCGYAVGNFYKNGEYDEICRHHTHVWPDEDAQSTPDA